VICQKCDFRHSRPTRSSRSSSRELENTYKGSKICASSCGCPPTFRPGPLLLNRAMFFGAHNNWIRSTFVRAPAQKYCSPVPWPLPPRFPFSFRFLAPPVGLSYCLWYSVVTGCHMVLEATRLSQSQRPCPCTLVVASQPSAAVLCRKANYSAVYVNWAWFNYDTTLPGVV